MADYLGLTPYTVSRYINRKAEVPLQTLRLWALRTGVPFEWLETGKTPGGNDPDGGGQWWAIRDSNPGPTGSRLSPLRPGVVIPFSRELEPTDPAIAS